MQGWADSPLTAQGRQDAARQAALLADEDLAGFSFWVSPLGRAMQTAEIALAAYPAGATPHDDLREIAMGEWTGRLRDELVVENPTAFAGDSILGWYDHAPNGEGLLALEARCAAFLATLDGPAVLVTHGITSRMLRALAHGQSPPTIADLPGGQGNVHIVRDGRHETLS